MSYFERDLQRGFTIEKLVLEELKKRFPCATVVDKFKGYDIWIPERSFGVEVKYDQKSNETGNYLIEYEMNDKPSALMATTAKFWAIYDGSTLMYIKPMEIIRCIFDHKYTHRILTGDGDSKAKKCFLIKKHHLIEYRTKEMI